MTKLIIPAVCTVFCIFCGCVREPDPGMEQVISRLEQINSRLEDMKRRTNPFEDSACAEITGLQWGDGIDYPALDRIGPLPPAPGSAEITRYLQAITEATRNRRSVTPSDRAVEMVRKIGFGHLKELAPYWDNPSVFMAASGLFRGEDVKEALELLPEYPALYRTVSRYEEPGSPRLKAAVFRAFRENRRDLSALSGVMLAYIKTPEDLRFFADCYLDNPAAYFVLEKIKYFPGVDEKALAAEAWELRGCDSLPSRLRLAETQLQLGNRDALALVVSRGCDSAEKRLKVAECFWEPETARNAAWEAVAGYFWENKDRLVFDPEKKRYIIRNGVE